jgi:hypothetical protein
MSSELCYDVDTTRISEISGKLGISTDELELVYKWGVKINALNCNKVMSDTTQPIRINGEKV